MTKVLVLVLKLFGLKVIYWWRGGEYEEIILLSRRWKITIEACKD